MRIFLYGRGTDNMQIGSFSPITKIATVIKEPNGESDGNMLQDILLKQY